MQKIAFIGLGNMGHPMALHLARVDDYVLIGFDVVDTARARFGDVARADIAASIEAAVVDADIVISMLPSGVHVEAVYCGDDGVGAHCKAGALLIDCSTIDVATARAVNAAMESREFMMLDAPVSGGVGGAEAASLTFMVGGSEDGFIAAQPILAHMGKNIFHAGGAGNGQAAKICNNMLLGVTMLGTCEAFLLGERLGLDPQVFFDIAATASGQSWSLTSYCPVPGPVASSPANRDYAAGFAAAMMLKDLKLAQSSAVTPMGAHAAVLYQKMFDEGAGGQDFSGIINMLRNDMSK